ncbi:MAG: AAA family ATPase [Rubrivivax sp.]|nr:AAA family ATPase [Rubrivivax sp.]
MSKLNITQKALLQEITRFYLESHDFNGISVSQLATRFRVTPSDLIDQLTALVRRELVSVVFGDIHPNPHIRAFSDEPEESQIAKLNTQKLDHACAYPLSKHLKKVVDRRLYEGKPYTLSLALGTPQLEFRAFDISVLEDYRNDPRYYYDNDDIRGSISVRSDYYGTGQMADSDQVLLQTFGFCYDDDLNRAVAVFVRYLSDLSPEHQQIWKTRELKGKYRLHPDYYRNSVLGEWGEGISIFDAFLEEMGIINQMAEAMGRPQFFRQVFQDKEKPREFGFIVRPTLKEFNDFVLLLDKMISDNINMNFFQSEVPYEQEQIRNDGKVIAQPKGTLSVLDDWIHSKYRTDDWKSIKEMLETFRDIRKKRQKPAHAVNENVFDQKYFREQRQLIIRAYQAVRTLRLMLGNHPHTKDVKIHEIIRDGKIWTY